MKKLEWDYTALAESFSYRPNYADSAVDATIECVSLEKGSPVLDLGAGTAHLTLKLAAREMNVTALEPNQRMREIGQSRTAGCPNVLWRDALMEVTGLPPSAFALATYGSSFGVADYGETLREAHRVLRPGGAIALLFNHRDLDDPLQSAIESLIRVELPEYAYGNRRVDQTALLQSFGFFNCVRRFEAPFIHEQSTATWTAAWSSHATLARQAGDRFPAIVGAIQDLIARRCGDSIRVPYATRVWIGIRA